MNWYVLFKTLLNFKGMRKQKDSNPVHGTVYVSQEHFIRYRLHLTNYTYSTIIRWLKALKKNVAISSNMYCQRWKHSHLQVKFWKAPIFIWKWGTRQRWPNVGYRTNYKVKSFCKWIRVLYTLTWQGHRVTWWNPITLLNFHILSMNILSCHIPNWTFPCLCL